MALSIDKFFHNFDFGILNFLHEVEVSAGGFFTPFFKIISVFGDKGIFFILLGVMLALFKKTRRLGFSILGAIAVGALFTNVILKNLIARTRPFLQDKVAEYALWHENAGGVKESGYSFPSGHVTATMASMTAIFLRCNKKWSFTGFFFVILMGLSRNYLMVHYPSDVLAGVLVGGGAGVISYFVTNAIYKFMEKNTDKKFFNFILSFSVCSIFNKKAKAKEDESEETKKNEEIKQ